MKHEITLTEHEGHDVYGDVTETQSFAPTIVDGQPDTLEGTGYGDVTYVIEGCYTCEEEANRQKAADERKAWGLT